MVTCSFSSYGERSLPSCKDHTVSSYMPARWNENPDPQDAADEPKAKLPSTAIHLFKPIIRHEEKCPKNVLSSR